MQSWAFPSKNTGTPDAPVYDRPITHLMERAVTRAKYTNGIFVTKLDAEQNAFKVTSLGTMNVVVKPGICHINGALAWQDTDFDVAISPAHATLNRKDIIVLRLDDTEDVRAIEIIKKEGSPSSVPTAPTLIRQDNIYELQLAEITINAKVEGITDADISDKRLNNDVCGLVVPAIPVPFDTKALYTQIENDLKLFRETYEAEFSKWSTERKAQFEQWFTDRESDFNTWFDSIKGKLGTDLAGNLQLQIDNITPKNVKTTMEASKWSGKIYSFEDIYPASDYDFDLQLQFGQSDEIIDAWNLAGIHGGDIDNNRVEANGIIPKIDLPVVISYTKINKPNNP